MNERDLKACLDVVCKVALKAGDLMYANWRLPKQVNEVKQHDIKLALDVKCQELISSELKKFYPEFALFGEEGCEGATNAPYRWVVDPIDGTVNFVFEIPHACTSIALQKLDNQGVYQTILGVVYEPFCKEMWTATRDEVAMLNGKAIHSSERNTLEESVISVGFAKMQKNVNLSLEAMARLTSQVRKVRIMGSAALDLTYVATGRLDAYLEAGVRLWDIAAAGFILEKAGGHFGKTLLTGPTAEPESYKVDATNHWLAGKFNF